MNYELELTQEDIEFGILEMTLEDIRYAIIDGYVIDVKNELEAFKQLRHTLLHLDVIMYKEINRTLMELSSESEEEASKKYYEMYKDGYIRDFEYVGAVKNRLNKFTFESIGINNVFEEGLFGSKKLGIYAVNKEMYAYKCYNMNSIPELLDIFAVYDELVELLFERFDEYTEDVSISAKDRFEELFRKNII